MKQRKIQLKWDDRHETEIHTVFSGSDLSIVYKPDGACQWRNGYIGKDYICSSFSVPVFNIEIAILTVGKQKELDAIAAKVLTDMGFVGTSIALTLGGCHGWVIPLVPNQFMMAVHTDILESVLVHESSHIALYCADFLDVKPSGDHSEFFCYLVQFIYENAKELHELHKQDLIE